MPTVSRLFFYPIKSARGIEVTSAHVTPLGLLHDRRFMFVDAHGVFVSQREHPALARMVPRIDGEHLVVSVDGLGSATVALSPEGPPVDVEVWGDRVRAVHASGLVEELASELLGARLRFVHFPDDGERQVDLAYAERGERTAFSDGFPLLVVGAESVRAVSRLVGRDVPVERFRPNVVVDGAPAWDEETWRELDVAGRRLRLPKPCARCAITTVDHLRGERGREPLATLSRERAVDHKVTFGMNALIDGPGTLAAGDLVVVTRRALPIQPVVNPVEQRGIEPLTFALRTRRSPS